MLSRTDVIKLIGVALLAIAVMAAGCSRDGATPADGDPDAANSTEAPAAPPPLPEFAAAVARVYTTSPGYAVFVDGIPVRDAAGEISLTPCAVTSPPGTHSLTVARQGEQDLSRVVTFVETGSDEFFDTGRGDRAGDSALLSAVLLNATPGVPFPLAQINTAGRESDPYLTPDGLSLWFVGDRPEGRGIYYATRPTPLDDFGPPRLLTMTRGADMPASPAVSLDGTGVVYTVPDKTRVWLLTRDSPLAEFEERRPLYFDDAAGEQWLSAQLLVDGLRLYYVREAGGKRETRVAIRAAADKPFDRVLIVAMPGTHPCLSQAGLRQYAFDGKTLQRARRTEVTSPFSAPETIAQLDLPGYRHSPRHRQYWVSEDEHWLLYCDDPETGGDLYLVKLAEQPGWGVALRGEPIEQRVMAANEPPPRRERPMPVEPETPEERPVDPRNIPLAYTLHRAELLEAVAARNYDAAAEIVAAARENPDLAAAAELVEWDAEDVAELRLFWENVTAAAQALQPGEEFRDGSLKLEFVRYENGALVGKARTRESVRPLTEIKGSSLVELVAAHAEGSDAERDWQATVFLAYDPETTSSTLDRRLSDAGQKGTQFREQLAQRLLRQAEWELERQATNRALDFIRQVSESHAGTQAASGAAALRDRLYASYGWQPRGNREWQNGPLGEFAAKPERADGAVLISPMQYERFELTMEYRMTAPNGQGGVFFRYPGSGPFYNRCFKIQLSNDPGVNADEYCTGSLFGIEAPKSNAAGPQGEWQTFRMRVLGEEVKVWINDALVLDTTAIDDQIPESGYIALDGIVGGIAYRKALVSEL